MRNRISSALDSEQGLASIPMRASPARQTGLAVLDQLTPGQPTQAGEHGDAGRRAHR
jgi:hypothetical protein